MSITGHKPPKRIWEKLIVLQRKKNCFASMKSTDTGLSTQLNSLFRFLTMSCSLALKSGQLRYLFLFIFFNNFVVLNLVVLLPQVFVLRDKDSILIKAGVIPEEITKHRQQFLRCEIRRTVYRILSI